MLYPGTDPEWYITEYTLVYEETRARNHQIDAPGFIDFRRACPHSREMPAKKSQILPTQGKDISLRQSELVFLDREKHVFEKATVRLE